MAASPPPALAPPPGNPRFPLLDPMRAIAALSILVLHTAYASRFTQDHALGAYTARLDVGVTIFFLLSGFLLYRPFVAARLQGRPPIRIRDFARRRVLRIVPAYWVALTLLALWPGLPGFWEGQVWRSYAFAQNLWLESTTQGLFPAWTLCIEAAFYVVLPFLAAGIGRVAGRRWGVELALLGAIAVASVAARGAYVAAAPSSPVLNTLVTYLDWFAYGMAIAVVSVVWHGREEGSRVLRLVAARPWLPWLAAAAVFWFVATRLDLSNGFATDSVALELAQHVGYALVAALLLLPAIFCDTAGGLVRRVLAWPVLAWLGLVSYGIFLYHGPFVTFFGREGAEGWLPGSELLSLTVVVAAVTIPCAALSYYLVERPVLRFKDGLRRTRSGSRPASRRSAARASSGA